MGDDRRMQFSVQASTDAVSAWSETRLQFEPRGWQVNFRTDLRAALRGLVGDPRRGMLAEYEAPDDTLVDVENVLVYNVGLAGFAPLIGAGLTCRRGRSVDQRHHVRYRVVDSAPHPGHELVVGEVVAELGQALPKTAGEWWRRLRPYAVSQPGRRVGVFAVDVLLSGPNPTGTRVMNLIKPMLDGLISCFHVHDGSHVDQLQVALAGLGPVAETWQRLTDPSTAVLGVRSLVRPYRNGVAWNPADDRCHAFRIRSQRSDRWSIHAQIGTFKP